VRNALTPEALLTAQGGSCLPPQFGCQRLAIPRNVACAMKRAWHARRAGAPTALGLARPREDPAGRPALRATTAVDASSKMP
jgi:hypothetical protein